MAKNVLIFYYLPTSAYALNVLLGALEKHGLDDVLDIHLPRKLADLEVLLSDFADQERTCIVLWSFFSATFPVANEQISYLKQRYASPTVWHVAGGVHASAEPQHTLSAGFDFVAVGEGEEIIVELAKELASDRSIENVKGLCRLNGAKMLTNAPARRIELDDYPPFAPKHGRFNPIEITRGCIYACKFCQTPFMFKAKFRHRSIENIAYYVKIMADRGLKDIRFISPTSLSYGSQSEEANLDEVERLLARVRSIIGTDGKLFFGSFPSEIRPEHATPEAFDVLRKYIDNDNIIIGGQSGSETVLEHSKRGHGVDVIETAVRYALEAGFTPNVDFLFGLPGESQDDAKETIRLADRLSDLGAKIHGHTFMPLPGTPFKDELPGKMNERTRRKLERLTSRGKLYGKWRQQVGIAEKMNLQQKDAAQRRAEFPRGSSKTGNNE